MWQHGTARGPASGVDGASEVFSGLPGRYCFIPASRYGLGPENTKVNPV